MYIASFRVTVSTVSGSRSIFVGEMGKYKRDFGLQSPKWFLTCPGDFATGFRSFFQFWQTIQKFACLSGCPASLSSFNVQAFDVISRYLVISYHVLACLFVFSDILPCSFWLRQRKSHMMLLTGNDKRLGLSEDQSFGRRPAPCHNLIIVVRLGLWIICLSRQMHV